MRVDRLILLYSRMSLADVVLGISSLEPGSLPQDLYDSYWPFITGTYRGLVSNDGSACSIRDLWDGAFVEATGTTSDRAARTMFGPVAIGHSLPSSPSSPGVVGVEPGHVVHFEHNRMAVKVPLGSDLEQFAGAYVLLAALCGRSRHIVTNLMIRISSLAEISDTEDSPDAPQLLKEAANIQRLGVLARRELRPTDFFGNPELIRIYNESAISASLVDYNSATLDEALSGLDRLVNAFFAISVEESQRKLNTIGFCIAALSVFFGAAGYTQFLDARGSDQAIIVVLWVVSTLLVAGLLFFLARVRRSRLQLMLLARPR